VALDTDTVCGRERESALARERGGWGEIERANERDREREMEKERERDREWWRERERERERESERKKKRERIDIEMYRAIPQTTTLSIKSDNTQIALHQEAGRAFGCMGWLRLVGSLKS